VSGGATTASCAKHVLAAIGNVDPAPLAVAELLAFRVLLDARGLLGRVMAAVQLRFSENELRISIGKLKESG
jgi:hypothetical protein